MRSILEKLERFHNWPVDIEFTVEIARGTRIPTTPFISSSAVLRSATRNALWSTFDTIAASDLILQTTELVPRMQSRGSATSSMSA